MSAAANQLPETLLAHRPAFRAFLASRLNDARDVDDLLQNSLIKALQHPPGLRDDDKAVAWFYRVLRNAVIDHARSRHAAAAREKAWALDTQALSDDGEANRMLCACFERMLPALKPAHAELLRRVELEEQSVSAAALALGITANHASVLLHRARQELRTRLIEFCGSCACLDHCDCEPLPTPAS